MEDVALITPIDKPIVTPQDDILVGTINDSTDSISGFGATPANE